VALAFDGSSPEAGVVARQLLGLAKGAPDERVRERLLALRHRFP
jgi:hypothetical protein